jgi:hypothetical protein
VVGELVNFLYVRVLANVEQNTAGTWEKTNQTLVWQRMLPP